MVDKDAFRRFWRVFCKYPFIILGCLLLGRCSVLVF